MNKNELKDFILIIVVFVVTMICMFGGFYA